MGFKDKMVRSATKFGQGIVDTGHRAFNAVTENRRNALQVDLPSQRPSAYEAEELLENTYTLPALSQQMQQRSEQTKTQQDTLIEKVENVAFRHHYYRARDNYEPSFSLCNPDSERFAIKRDPYMQSVRGIMLRRFVITNEELQTEKMNNIFSSMASLGSTLALVIHRNPEDCTVSFLTSTTRSDVDESGFGLEDRADQTLETLDNVLRGNFPGTQTCRIGANREPNTFAELKELFSNAEERPEDSVQGWMRLYRLKGDDAFTKDGDAFPYNVGDLMDEVFYRDNRKAIAAVTGVPSLKSSDSKFITQGIEKLIDGIVPQDESESYTLMLLAAPLSPQQVALVRNGYEQMASQLSPLKEFQFTVTASQGNSASATMTEALNRQISEATTLAAGVGAHAGVSANASCSTGFSEGTNDSRSTGENWSKGTNGSHSESHLGVKKKAPVIHTKSDTKGWSKSKGGSTTETSGSSTTENFGAQASAGANAGISAHLDMTENLSGGRSYCWNSAATKSLESSLSQGETRTYTSEPVKRVLERLHQEIQRLEASESSGMWRFAGYAIAGSFAMAQRVASVYQGMIQGEGSEVERSSVNIWTERDKGFNAIITSLLNFEHPQFRCTKENSTLPADMYCATELTSAELALAMALPQKAVPGLPVVTCASFGRSVQTMDDEQIIPSDSLQ